MVCSNDAVWLTRIGEAIDQLAADAAATASDEPHLVASRIAAIWTMMAEIDPGLARQLRGYTETEPGERAPGTPGPGSA